MFNRAVLPHAAATATPVMMVPPMQAARRELVHAAVLSHRADRLLAALAARDITAVDATPCDLALLRRDAPDMLVLDLDPGLVPPRRLALLVAQLGWARPDVVIAASRETARRAQGFAIDIIFDTEADDETLADTLATGRQLIALSRLRHAPVSEDAPAVLRHAAPRRRSLFR